MKTVRDILEIVVAALILAALLRFFVVETYTVEGPSMEDTLHNGQRLLVSKISLRFKKPARGDVVVFRYPLNHSREYVKRVIAVEGDTVEIRMGRVYVNNERQEEPYVRSPGLYDMKATTIPEDHIFVLGDNRTNSEDSRYFGPVKSEEVRGMAMAILWPPKALGKVK